MATHTYLLLKANARAAPVEIGLTLETELAISAKVKRYNCRAMAAAAPKAQPAIPRESRPEVGGRPEHRQPESSDQTGVPAR